MLVHLGRGPEEAPQQGCQALHAQQQSGQLASRLLVRAETCAIHAACEMTAGGALLYCWALLASWVVAEPAAALLTAHMAVQMLATGSCWALHLHHHYLGSSHASHDGFSACWIPLLDKARDHTLFSEHHAGEQDVGNIVTE